MFDKINISPKRTIFVQEYLKDFNGTRSAIAAGYSPKSAAETASEILTNPKVTAMVAESIRLRCERIQVDADWVLDQAVQVYHKCMIEVPSFDRNGSAVGQKVDPANAIRALELIGKHVNVLAFRDRLEITTSQDLTERLKRGRERMNKKLLCVD